MTDPHHGVAAGSSAQHYAVPPRIVAPGVPTEYDHAGRATTTEDVDPDAPADLLVSHLIADLGDLRERVLRLERIVAEGLPLTCHHHPRIDARKERST